jgi:catalase (peroxidase I)
VIFVLSPVAIPSAAGCVKMMDIGRKDRFMRKIAAGALLLVFMGLLGYEVEAQDGKRRRRKVDNTPPNWTAEETFKNLDTNKNQKLSWTEFSQYRGIPHGKQGIASAPKDAKDLNEMFKRIDINDDNIVDSKPSIKT